MSSSADEAAAPAPRTLVGPGVTLPGEVDAGGFYEAVQVAVPGLVACGAAGPARFEGGPAGLVRVHLLDPVPGAAVACVEGVLASGRWPPAPAGLEVEVQLR